MNASSDNKVELSAASPQPSSQNDRPCNEIHDIVSLEKLNRGAGGTVVALTTDNHLQGRLMGMGLSVGARFRILHVSGSRRRIFRLAVHETRLALDGDVAQFIMVEPD